MTSQVQNETFYREGFVTSQDGLSLYYRDYEPASTLDTSIPVLCLPGLARNSKDFAMLAPDIAAGKLGPARRVLCLDYRGRGRSDYAADANTYRPEQYLDDIRHVRTALGLHQFMVIGSSMGGLLGMALSLSCPSALKALVLNDIGPDIGGTGFNRIIDYLKKKRLHPSLKEAEDELRCLFKQPGWSDTDWKRATEASFTKEETYFRPDWDPAIVIPLQSPHHRPDLWRIFKGCFATPTLALRGEHSDILTQKTLLDMDAVHPHFTQQTIPGAGHTPTLNEPLSREALFDFLTRYSLSE